MERKGSNQLKALGLYTLWSSELAPRIQLKVSAVLNGKNRSLLSESLILGRNRDVHSAFFPGQKIVAASTAK